MSDSKELETDESRSDDEMVLRRPLRTGSIIVHGAVKTCPFKQASHHPVSRPNKETTLAGNTAYYLLNSTTSLQCTG